MPRSHSKLGQLAIIVLCAIVVWLVYKMPTPTSTRPPLPIPALLPILMTEIRDGNARYSCEMNLCTVPEFQRRPSPTDRLCDMNICSTVTTILSATTVTLPNGKQQRFTFRGKPTGEDTVEPQHH
jgi:hypothetical protein